MSKELSVNGKTYHTTAALAGRFSYTSDYLGKLARDGKVEATRVGRQWFIDEGSLKKFIAASELGKKQRSADLRAERKQERVHFSRKQHNKNSQPVSPEVEVAPGSGKVKLDSGSPDRRMKLDHVVATALAQSVAVVMCGFVVGVIGFNVVTAHDKIDVAGSMAHVSTSAFGVVESYALNNPRNQKAFLDFSILIDWLFDRSELVVAEQVSNTPEAMTASGDEMVLSVQRSALLLIDEQASTTVEDIRRSFSDETEVTFDGPDTGVIRPVFRERQDPESYRFLVVPVNEDVN